MTTPEDADQSCRRNVEKKNRRQSVKPRNDSYLLKLLIVICLKGTKSVYFLVHPLLLRASSTILTELRHCVKFSTNGTIHGLIAIIPKYGYTFQILITK